MCQKMKIHDNNMCQNDNQVAIRKKNMPPRKQSIPLSNTYRKEIKLKWQQYSNPIQTSQGIETIKNIRKMHVQSLFKIIWPFTYVILENPGKDKNRYNIVSFVSKLDLDCNIDTYRL